MGLYSAKQVQGRSPRSGQIPECGVVEVKPSDDDAWLIAESVQVGRYWSRYKLVLVTNTRDFVLLGEDSQGRATKLETFKLAESDEDFDRLIERPHTFASDIGVGLGEYLCRALSHNTTLAEPEDIAWLLASYARDGLARIEAAEDTPSLVFVRSALEEALGIRFKGARGEAFFHSTLIQTLFYGIFSAWVLWCRQPHPSQERFDWRLAVWHLRVPVLRALFQQIASPSQLHPFGLVEVLDWAAAALDRVDRMAFFMRFDEGQAVPYFYEPFLKAFDPALRKQLGVWYTPPEVVRYMVARVDMALRDDLHITDGLAAENVYVLDPCCGTGAYVSEVLRRIAQNVKDGGAGALTGARVKKAASERVFGFEIMPAPFVVAHLQVGITLQELDASLSEDGTERAGIFLTNALTGWEPTVQKPLPFPELEEERDRAERVKQDTPVLVIMGNPPYNGFAGMAVDEERELSTSYRTTKCVRLPEGQGLNDLYVRFFRMAERRIAEKTGQGVICFISNYSWLDGLSFTGMRERYLQEFDAIRIDSLNGDKYRTGKVAPDGSPDPSIFSTASAPDGIQVGTAIVTLVRRAAHVPAKSIGFRNLWGRGKWDELAETEQTRPERLYDEFEPILPLGLPFAPIIVSRDWHDWPALPELFPTSFPGVTTNRDSFLVDIDLDRLKVRISDYFNADLTHDEIARRYPVAMKDTTSVPIDAMSVRDMRLGRGGPDAAGYLRYSHRPFDTRWIYWESDSGLLARPSPAFRPHVFEGNMFIEVRKRESTERFLRGTLVRHLAGDFGNGRSHFIPAWLRDDGLRIEGEGLPRRPNLSLEAQVYLDRVGAGVEDLFHHVLAVLHDPVYREANAGALRMEWPRIPLPGWPNGDTDRAADAFMASAMRGRELAALLDSDTPVPGVTAGALRDEVASIAIPSTTDGRNIDGDDFDLTAGWGYFGSGEAVMPGQGRVTERFYTSNERIALGRLVPKLGDTTFDIFLNDHAYWKNVPSNIWNYKLGGYQVLKKWLSYRERKVLERALLPGEIQDFADTARRIGSIWHSRYVLAWRLSNRSGANSIRLSLEVLCRNFATEGWDGSGAFVVRSKLV